MKTVIYLLIIVPAALVAICPSSRGGEVFVFPVGIWVTEDLRRADERWPFDIPAERLVDLRSKGVEMIILNGWYSGKKWYEVAGNIWFDTVMVDVVTLRQKLARADSFGFLVYADPKSIDETLKYWGHNPENVQYPYFRMYNDQQFSEQAFKDTLDSLVSWVVDSLNMYLQANDIQSLYRYIFWDEPYAKHLREVRNQTHSEDDYWYNFWLHDDTTGLYTDSIGVGTLLKHKLEEKDTLHSVWINFNGDPAKFADTCNPLLGFSSLHYYGSPNPPHQFSFDCFPISYDTKVGDSTRLRANYTDVIDTIVWPAKDVNPNNPPPAYLTQLMSWGSCNLDSTHKYRITTPEEVKVLANLAALHEVKGIMHYVLWSAVEQGDLYAALWDDDLVPFDAPYEEYVYNRKHSAFFDPDTLRPFCTNIPSESLHTDPFRPLPTEPVDSLGYHKFLEDYYEWKYAPYARNYDALGEVNNQLQIIGTELLDLWRAPSVATIQADSTNIFLPEIVTFSPTTASDLYLFYVNKDMKHSHMEFTVTITTSALPPSLRSAYILDLSERHLIERTVDWWHITFRDTLGAGEGKLVRLTAGTELGDAMVTDPDIKFEIKGASGPSTKPQHIFTEGDSIRISATVYNLGFTPLDTVIVKFYDGHRDPSNLMRSDTISLSPLTSTATSDSAASFVWSTSHDDIAPHNITVFVEEPLPSATNTDNNEANMGLVILPEDYATAVRGDPWDMTETGGGPGTADIDSFQGFVETPDSISGVWEAETKTDSARIFLDLAGPIDGSEYNQFSVRLIQDPGSSGQAFLKLGWRTVMGTAGEDSLRYHVGKWDVQGLSLDMNPMWYNREIASLWIRPVPAEDKIFKLAWVKLTTRKP